MVENKRGWKDLLISIDEQQRGFNEQVEGVQAHKLTPRLVAALKRYARYVFTRLHSRFLDLIRYPRALEKLAARIMEQAGVVEKEVPKEGPLNKIRVFADLFLNADSAADDIASYKRELDAAINDVQVRIMTGCLNKANVVYCIRPPS